MRINNIQKLIVFVFLFSNTIIYPQQKNILIVAECENLPEESKIHIAGNTDEMGNWNEMLVLEKMGTNEWGFEITADVGDTLEFKFTRGSWRSEAVDSNGIEFSNFAHVVKEDTILVYNIPRWRDLVQQRIVISQAR